MVHTYIADTSGGPRRQSRDCRFKPVSMSPAFLLRLHWRRALEEGAQNWEHMPQASSSHQRAAAERTRLCTKLATPGLIVVIGGIGGTMLPRLTAMGICISGSLTPTTTLGSTPPGRLLANWRGGPSTTCLPGGHAELLSHPFAIKILRS